MTISGKRLISSLLPASLKPLIWCLTDRQFRSAFFANRRRQLDRRSARNRVGAYLHEQFGSQVVAGPFEGMPYLTCTGRSIPAQKLLGTYEKELWPIIETIVMSDYACVINIGAAEGYYVVGLARRIPTIQVIAFEAEAKYQTMIQQLAIINDVHDRVRVEGSCSTSTLGSVIPTRERCLIICDIEGNEDGVLDPSEIPRLAVTDMLIEVHEHIVPGVAERLRKRFEHSHSMQVVLSRPRTAGDWPLDNTSYELPLVLAMDECRHPESKWFWMVSKGNAHFQE